MTVEVEGIALENSYVLGTPLTDETDVERLKKDVIFLWDLLDDIDTMTDIAKSDDVLYRAKVEKIQGRRHTRITSDGYSLFVVPEK